ncbi:MAG: thioredoxin family protein [Chitinophagaceae bacterium]
MHKVTLSIIMAFVLFFFSADRPVAKAEKLKWMTLKEAQEAMQKEKRPILIDLYTDWCGWCKVMDKKTYTNPKVIAYLQQNFYPVKLNAETRDAVSWNDKTYNFNSANRTNDFAVFLTYGRLSYPTTVIIPMDNSGPQPVPGYLEPKDLELIVRYFGDGKYGKQPFEEYQKAFKSEW